MSPWTLAAVLACTSPEGRSGPGPDALPADAGIGQVGARRLSVDEVNRALGDVFLDDTQPAAAFLPPDVIDPLDNDIANQVPSAVLVAGLEALANDVATRLVADPERRERVVGCTPDGPTDEDCLRSFVEHTGRLALRRPPTAAEVDALVALGLSFADDPDSNGFWDAVDVVVRALVQEPAFVYRIERGAPTDEPGVYRLDGYEVATRLSFLLLGTTPDDALLDDAAGGVLDDPDGVRSVAERLLADPRAADRIDRFHAMWLGYWTLPHPPELTTAFRTETKALLLDVVFTRQAPWSELFTADGTFADADLAEYYGLSYPGGGGGAEVRWVPYGDSGRRGILSHGAFLSVNAKFGDTSPTLRGKLVRQRLMCQVVPPPPPTVNVDEPPGGEGSPECKVDRYEQHRSDGACRSCHEALDPVGFGLEQFDRAGLFREHDEGKPQCPLDGVGDLDGVRFVGPAGLADLLVAGDDLRSCVTEETYRLAMGHAPGADDAAYLARLGTAFGRDGRYDELLLALVSDDAFGYRRDEEVTP